MEKTGMLDLSPMDVTPSVPLSIWMTADRRRAKAGAEGAFEIVVGVRLMLSGEDVPSFTEKSKASEILPFITTYVEGLSIGGEPVEKFSKDTALVFPVWAANRIAREFQEQNGTSEEEEGN